MMKFMYKILKIIFKRIKPFDLSYSKKYPNIYIIGIRFNKFKEEGFVAERNSLGLFFGKKYKIIQWI